MRKLPRFFLFVSLAGMLIVLVGCGTTAKTLEGAELDAVLAFSEPMTNNLLEGLKIGNYAVFSHDFDDAMLKAIDEKSFADLKEGRDSTLGNYISREVLQVTDDGTYYVVFFLAQFEKQTDVTMRVVFHVDEPHMISGLWFNK